MSDTSGGLGWWQASDGKWYPPEQHPSNAPSLAAPSPLPPPPIPGHAVPQSPGFPPPSGPQATGYGQQLPGAYGVPAGGYAPLPPSAVATNGKKGILIGLLVVVAMAAIVVVAVVVILFVEKKPSNSAKVPASNLPAGETLQDFESSLEIQLSAPGAGGFDVTGISSVACNMTQVWAVGNTFTCFVYDSSGGEIGTVNGTIEPSTASNPAAANLNWQPNPSYGGSASSG